MISLMISLSIDKGTLAHCQGQHVSWHAKLEGFLGLEVWQQPTPKQDPLLELFGPLQSKKQPLVE